MNPISNQNWVGALIAGGLLLVTAPFRVSAQPATVENPSNIECLEHLEVPVYPPLARAGRFPGTLLVKVLLSDQATLQSVDISIQEKAVNLVFFKESAEKAVKNSRFSKTCGGQAITLVFHYEPSNDNGSFAFEPPNHFWIRSGAVRLNPEASVK